MRKIAANYIFLPGHELVRNGYVILDENHVHDVVDTGGSVHEIPCLEFYGGMIVADVVWKKIAWEKGDDILERITALYRETREHGNGLALIEGADLCGFKWLVGTRVVRLK